MLVETLAALAILSGVLVSTYSAISTSLVLTQQVMARSAAVAMVERQVGLLRSQVLAKALSMSGEIGTHRWKIDIQRLGTGPGRAVALIRITGRIVEKAAVRPRLETVVDTILLGPAS